LFFLNLYLDCEFLEQMLILRRECSSLLQFFTIRVVKLFDSYSMTKKVEIN